MKGLALFINENFYRNSKVITSAVEFAKLNNFFKDDYRNWIRTNTGLPSNCFAAGVFLAYLCQCYDNNLGQLIVKKGFNNEPIYINSEEDVTSRRAAGITHQQLWALKSLEEDINDIHLSQQEEGSSIYAANTGYLFPEYNYLKNRYIDVKGEDNCIGKYRLRTSDSNGKNCINDFEKIFKAAGIKYDIVNLSKGGHAQADNWFIIDNFKNYLK